MKGIQWRASHFNNSKHQIFELHLLIRLLLFLAETMQLDSCGVYLA